MTAAQPGSSQASSSVGCPGLTDEEVVARVRAGDRALYEILMRRHNQRLYRAVRAILRDESEIEDILQEAHLVAYRSLADFEGRSRFSTWLVRIAVNKALDRLRRRSRLVALDPETEARPAESRRIASWSAASEDPEQHSARRELAHRLERAIDALPDAFRAVYVLRDVDGMSTQETAASLDLEVATVKTRLHRARGLLRERLLGEFDAGAIEVFPFGGRRCDRLVAAVLARIESDAR
jgi:RNA polymerase sigma-70 factor (ECF subfamily)